METYRLPTLAAAMKQGLSVPSTVDGGGSSLYRRAIKLQCPTVIKWQDRLANSVSLIGSVLFSPTQCNTNNDRFGVHTVLRAESLVASAQRCDLCLGEIKKFQAFEDGETKIKFQVNVEELNYVAPILRPYHPAEPEVKKSGTGSLESQKYRLHLWNYFFANPRDWWDNRKRKAHSRLPDCRHKDTNEPLWLSPNDPFLQLHKRIFNSAKPPMVAGSDT